MANIIKYYLDNGNIPSYVITEKDGEKSAGLWPNADMALIGLGNITGSESEVTVFGTVEELIAYMQTYMYDARILVFNYENATTSYAPFDIEPAANHLWSLLQ